MELIYGYVAIVFAWLMLGYILTPLIWITGFAADKLTRYATVDQYKFTFIHDKYAKLFWKWREYHEDYNSETPQFIISCFVWAIYVLGLIPLFDKYRDTSSSELLTYYLFGVWVDIGMFLAPVLVVVGVVAGIIFLSRKVFSLKIKLEEHMQSKNAHKGEV